MMLLLLLLIFLVGLLVIVWNSNKEDGQPPGPIRIPLLGNVFQLYLWAREGPQTHAVMKKLSEAYGPVAQVHFGLLKQVVIDDPTLIREVLQSDVWGQRPYNLYILDRSFGKPLGILWSRGEINREMRRFSLRTLRDFGFGKQSSQEVMESELKELMARLDVKLETGGPIQSMTNFFNVSVLNIIWTMIGGERLSHDDPKLLSLVTAMNKTLRLLSPNNPMMAYPMLRHLLAKLTGYGRIRDESNGQLFKFFWDKLKERRQRGEYATDQRDFIDVFAKQIDEGKQFFDDEQFAVTLLDLFGAGSETTANTLEFAILLMILHPTVQSKVRKEIDEVIGATRAPTVGDRPMMPYTEATLLEILRISSVVPVVVRAPTEDTVVAGYKIPKETFTILNTYSVHRNPEIWGGDYEDFNPSRFLQNGKVVHADKLIPFGLGKRYCIGEILARTTLFVYFVTMLQNYEFYTPPNEPKPILKAQPGITLSPHPYNAFIRKRE